MIQHSGSISRRLAACIAVACIVGSLATPAHAQVRLTFDYSQIGTPSLASGTSIYVAFSGAESDITLALAGGTDSLQFGTYTAPSFNVVSTTAAGTQLVTTTSAWTKSVFYDGYAYATSKAYSLAAIQSGTVTINSGTSVRGYIVYGPTDSTALNTIALRPAAMGQVSPYAGSNNPMIFNTGSYNTGTFAIQQTAPRYTEFEFNYSGTSSTGFFDLTNIDQYGGGLRMSLLSASGTQQSSWNVPNSGDQFRGLAALTSSQAWAGGTNTFPNGNWQSNPLITTGSSGTGDFVRVIGPSKFPNGAPGSGATAGNTAYGTFNNYLSLLASGSLQATGTLTNQATGAQPGGTGALGGFSGAGTYSSSGQANANYYFTPTVTATTTNGTTYAVTLSGSVVFVPTSGTAIAATYPLQIVIGADQTTASPPDQPLLMTNFINQVPGIGQGIYSWTDGGIISLTLASGSIGSGTSAITGSWQQMDADWAGAASSTIAQKVYGDFAEGMLAGLVGNPTISGSTAIGAMTSYEWWQDPSLAYNTGTTGNVSAWGSYVWNNSLLTRPSGPNPISGTSVGGVYGSVYDDRWSRNTLNSDASTTTLQITLLPDGDLSVAVPEPSAVALLAVAGATLGGFAWQRRRRAPNA